MVLFQSLAGCLIGQLSICVCVIFSIDVSYVLFCHTGGHVTVAAVMKLGRLLYTILVHEVSVCVQGLHQEAVIKRADPNPRDQIKSAYNSYRRMLFARLCFSSSHSFLLFMS